VRAEICAGLDYLGLRFDAAANEARNVKVISKPDSAFAVFVIATDEDRVIARHTASLLRT
jgi:acetate kinase